MKRLIKKRKTITIVHYMLIFVLMKCFHTNRCIVIKLKGRLRRYRHDCRADSQCLLC